MNKFGYYVVLFTFIIACNNNDSSTLSNDASANIEKVSIQDIPLSTVSMKDISQNIRKMTDVQWDSYVDSIIGKKVKFTGKVSDVSSDINSDYIVTVYYSNFKPLPVVDCAQIFCFKTSKDVAISLNPKQKITVIGIIESVEGTWADPVSCGYGTGAQVNLKNAKIEF